MKLIHDDSLSWTFLHNYQLQWLNCPLCIGGSVQLCTSEAIESYGIHSICIWSPIRSSLPQESRIWSPQFFIRDRWRLKIGTWYIIHWHLIFSLEVLNQRRWENPGHRPLSYTITLIHPWCKYVWCCPWDCRFYIWPWTFTFFCLCLLYVFLAAVMNLHWRQCYFTRSCNHTSYLWFIVYVPTGGEQCVLYHTGKKLS